MKRKILGIVLMLALILSFQSSGIATNTLENLPKNESEDEMHREDSAIVVGYLESDKKDIFGDLSDEEISEIMIEICNTIENADSSIEKNNMIQGLDSRIVILD
jgi:peptidoglycan hydrolase CwlO-like protein